MCNENMFKQMTKEDAVKELTTIISKNEVVYEKFNTTSIQYLNFIYKKFENDILITDLIHSIMNPFLLWYSLNKPNQYLPKHGLEPMYSMNDLQKEFKISIPTS